jgi:hypothetical protein
MQVEITTGSDPLGHWAVRIGSHTGAHDRREPFAILKSTPSTSCFNVQKSVLSDLRSMTVAVLDDVPTMILLTISINF